MHRIKVEDLYPLELKILEFHLDIIGVDDEERKFIYANLFRDENDVAYYPSKDRKKLLALFTD